MKERFVLKALLKSDVIISVIVFAGALYLFFETKTFGSLDVYGGGLGPGYWPRFILVSLMAFCAGLAFITVRAALKEKVLERPRITFSSHNVRFIAATALIASYLGLLPVIGFLVSTPLMMIAFMVLLGERSKFWLFSIPFVLTLAIVMAFTKIMYVPLPRGMGIFLKISHLLY